MPSLSSVLDRSIFIARNGSTPPLHDMPSIPTLANHSIVQERSMAQQTSHLSPAASPLRESTSHSSFLQMQSPARRHIEGVYDRFLMATTGVKRNGKGYQSDNMWAATSAPGSSAQHYKSGRNGKIFGTGTGRRAMPPPISSDDVKAGLDVDFGIMGTGRFSPANVAHDAPKAGNSVTKALKAIVSGKTVSKRTSRAI